MGSCRASHRAALDSVAFAGPNSGVYLLAVLVAATPLPRPLSPVNANDLDRAALLLRQHVAYLRARTPVSESQPLLAGEVDGWGVVTGAHEITCQSFLVEGATEIRVEGPTGVIEATVRDVNTALRVAHLDLRDSAASVGLQVATPSPTEAREPGMDVFALVSTRPRAGVVTGALTHLGEEAWLEGNLRSSLELARGMPVFDGRLRWLGISRTVAWDRDRAMLVPPELTLSGATRTATAAAVPPPPGEAPERPWWAQ